MKLLHGIDICSQKRIESYIETLGESFVNKILSSDELFEYADLNDIRRIEYLSSRFAGKEAYAKALKTGFTEKLTLKDITILNDENGAPYIVENDKAIISISHDAHLTIASVIIMEE